MVQKRLGSLSPLLSDTPESLYWMGFLLADGYFTENRLKVTLGVKDEDHLRKLGNFLGGVPVKNIKSKSGFGEFNAVTLAIMHSTVMRELRTKWGITNNKTYNPPKLDWLCSDALLYFMVGFIDGDGCIKRQSGRNDAIILIKNHATWLPILSKLNQQLHLDQGVTSSNGYLDTKGYANIAICKAEVIKSLKLKSYDVPSLSRKWDRIDETIKSRGARARFNAIEIKRLMEMGVSKGDIAKHLRISPSCVSNTIKRKKLQITF